MRAKILTFWEKILIKLRIACIAIIFIFSFVSSITLTNAQSKECDDLNIQIDKGNYEPILPQVNKCIN